MSESSPGDSTEILCTACGEVGAAAAGKCARCHSAEILPADSPLARKFIADRDARREAADARDRAPVRAEATGKVLGRTLGRLFKR